MLQRIGTIATAVLAVACLAVPFAAPSRAEEEGLPAYLADRGTGIPTSMFGTYVREGEWLIYPFFEYYRDSNAEYKPDELGFGLDEDFRGKYRASEGLIFIGYGISDRLAIEMEAAVISASLEKSPDDPSAMPERIEESGTGDVEGQLRWRWAQETETRPELFSYFEFVTPQQMDKVLIGTPDWELKLGSGIVRGNRWGTMTLRAAVEYDAAESKVDSGEYAIEYLKRINRAWSGFAGIEGSQDEASLITEAQWRFAPSGTLKLNNAFGITSKAGDWTPEIGLMFSL